MKLEDMGGGPSDIEESPALVIIELAECTKAIFAALEEAHKRPIDSTDKTRL